MNDIDLRRYYHSPPENVRCKTCLLLGAGTSTFKSLHNAPMKQYKVTRFGGVFGGRRHWYRCAKKHKACYEVPLKDSEVAEALL